MLQTRANDLKPEYERANWMTGPDITTEKKKKKCVHQHMMPLLQQRNGKITYPAPRLPIKYQPFEYSTKSI